jgi:tetratricopeptide (TPR) repeat protein
MRELGLNSPGGAIGRLAAYVGLHAMVLALPLTAQTGPLQSAGQNSPPPDQQRQQALQFEQQGKNAEAESAWRAYLKTHPSNAEPYAHLGLLEARLEHYKEAVPLYRKALALMPGMPGLRLNLGLALFKSGDLKQAIETIRPLLKSQPSASPEFERLTILLGMAHYGLGEYAEATPYLKIAAAVDPRNLQLQMTLAHSCLWSKQYQCVLDAYQAILTLNAESVEADMLAGEALDEMKDHPGAIRQFRAAVKADPTEPDVHFGLGYLLWSQKQFPEAASEFQAELTNNPKHAEAMTYLADTQMQLNQPEAAEPLLKNAIRIEPGREMAHLDLGILDADAGRQDDALQQFREAERLAPEDVNVHWRLGRLYRAMGRKDEAKAELDKASRITKAADNALIDKMDGARAKPAQAQAPVIPPDVK